MFKKIECHIGDRMKPQELVDALLSLNYARSEFVEQAGQYARRGNLVDLYPYYFKNPLRVEFAFSQIDSIRDFIIQDGSFGNTYQNLSITSIHEKFTKKRSSEELLSEDDFAEHFFKFKKGDYVVHLDYGIGKYLGIKKIKTKGVLTSYHAIEYADKEVIYADLDGPAVIDRYVGLEGRKPNLTKLRTKEWKRAKERTRLAVKNVARDLLKIQAKRELQDGFRFPKDNDWQKEFEELFPYEATEDQLKAIKEFKADMEGPKPMDRLLCGDVGYGKTEVAMRAAFKAVIGGKQVAFLVPTTILAEQHYLNFKERVEHFPVEVSVLSRFRTRKEQAAIVDRVKKGSCDVVIGTHRLLSKDIQFKDLGLLIIDEEQRFGVRHKEKLKKMRAVVDVLTLTATPIPRTLHLALMGARDMSTINTPPKTRLPVHTEVVERNDNLIKEIFDRELARQGQIFFVHNRVQSIERVHEKLLELMPHVRFCVGHGQMPAKELEQIMHDFMEGEYDCLISTAIVESGIDIPNCNTIIVDRADTFGLADLYQLRGRVGRYQKRRKAYAYFFVPKGFLFTKDAGKRLSAIEKFTDLGSGFKIAMEDLEIRGAGNILGHEQSGFIYQVGFDLYCRLLRKIVEEEK